jgi:hypothetical protein
MNDVATKADRMKALFSIAACVVAASLAAPARAQVDSDMPPMRDGSDLRQPEVKLPPDPVGAGEDLRLAGKCDRAVVNLRPFAERGAGNEIAQFNLGMCLLDLAAHATDPAKTADMRHEGAQWILQAANAGLGKAQAEAVVLYLDGTGVASDPAEADKWALIYHNNGMRISVGMPDIGPAVKSRLDAALTDAMRAQARSRADDWKQTVQASDQ